MILVAAAGLGAAGVWWWLSRSADRRGRDRRGAPRLVGFGGTAADDAREDFFVFAPSAEAAFPEDRPRAGMTLARLALTIAITTVVLVAAAWVTGFLLKLQLDRYFLSGG